MTRAAVLLVLLCLPCFAETVQIPASRDVWISSCGKECDTNMGKAPVLKLKGYQEYALLDFDVSALKGKTIVSATLHIAPAGGRKNAPEARGTDLRWFTLSTISSAWEEGLGTNYSLDSDGNGATFNEAKFEKKPWAHPGSKNWDVTLGNGNSLRCDVDGGDPSDGWFTIPVDKRLVEALVAKASHGMLLMDGSVFISTNAFIHSLEGGKGAFLKVTYEGEDAKAPDAPAEVTIEPAPNEASTLAGAVKVTLTVPADAFSFDARIDGKPLERWQIPFAAKAGAKQSFFLEYLPLQKFKLEIAAVDRAGNASAFASAEGTASDIVRVPRLPKPDFLPKGGEPPKIGNVGAWALPEISKLDPLTGEVISEKAMQDAFHRNSVWDAGSATVRVPAARGEIAAFQLAILVSEGDAASVKVSVEPPAGVTARLWRTWFVNVKDKWQGEYAIPFKNGEALTIPAADNKVEQQKVAVLNVDLIVPANAKAGEQAGKILIQNGDAQGSLALNLVVFDALIPDELNFWPELNCYQGPLGEAGTEKFFDAFRIAHYHRCTLNRVPHSHNGRTHQDYVPKVGPDGKVTDWTVFDKNLGPLLDGSAFKENPRAGVPVPALYLPFNESWPLPIGPNYKPGDNVPLVGKNWKQLHDIFAKAPEDAFPQSYKDAFAACVKDFVAHFEAKGWNRTIAECYNNNKVQYGKRDVLDAEGKPVMKDGKKVQEPGMTGTAWTLDEPSSWLDWQALLFYSKLFHKGLDGVKTTKFAYRGDISRPMWQGNCFDGYMEVMVSGGAQFSMFPLMRDQKRRMPTKLFAYGGCNSPDKANHNTTCWVLKAYAHECDGVLPWQSVGGDDAFDKGDGDGGNGNMLVVDGSKRFGVNAIASFRVHAFRSGSQLAELLRLLELKKGWSRSHSAALVAQLIPLRAEFKQSFADDAAALTFDDVNGDVFVRLKEGILKLLAQ